MELEAEAELEVVRRVLPVEVRRPQSVLGSGFGMAWYSVKLREPRGMARSKSPRMCVSRARVCSGF